MPIKPSLQTLLKRHLLFPISSSFPFPLPFLSLLFSPPPSLPPPLSVYGPRGKALCSKPELQQVLERRKKEQTQKEEGDQARTPLEEVLLKRQQKNTEREKHEGERVQEEAQLLEFVRVRQNLKKIQAFHKATNS
ncbi:unnamed protein product [Coregonus sp. 'balchen']|nr:unnamed protein product [Coregonus sp. 'balchen']